MKVLNTTEIEAVSGSGIDGWSFTGAELAVAAATIAVCTAPAWIATGAVLTIGAVGANAMSNYM